MALDGHFLGGFAQGQQQLRENKFTQQRIDQQDEQLAIQKQQAIQNQINDLIAQGTEAIKRAPNKEAADILRKQIVTTAGRLQRTAELAGGIDTGEAGAADAMQKYHSMLNVPSMEEQQALDQANYDKETQNIIRRDEAKKQNQIGSINSDVDLLKGQGVETTPQQYAQSLGLVPAPTESKTRVRDVAIDNLAIRFAQQNGRSEPTQEDINSATDIYDKNIEIQQDPETKQVVIVNKVDGTKMPIGTNEDILTEFDDELSQQGQPKGQTVFNALESGIGTKENITDIAQNLPFVGDLFFNENVAEAKQTLRLFRESAVPAFVKNSRAPVQEQERILKFLPDPDTFFKGERAAKKQTETLKNFLSGELIKELRISKDQNTSSDERKRSLQRVNDIKGILEQLGSPDDDLSTMTLDEKKKELEKLRKETSVVK